MIAEKIIASNYNSCMPMLSTIFTASSQLNRLKKFPSLVKDLLSKENK